MVTLGAVWILTSVGLSIFQASRVASPEAFASRKVDKDAVVECVAETGELTARLAKHLESFHILLGRYDQSAAQDWANEGGKWRKLWVRAGKECINHLRIKRPTADAKLRREIEQLEFVHRELGAIEASYTRELKRFGEEQAPRLDRIRDSIAQITKRIERLP